MPMTGYDDPTKPKRPAPLPGQPTEKPEDPNPLGPGAPPDKADTPQWGYGGAGSPDAMTNGGFGGQGAYDGSGINPQAPNPAATTNGNLGTPVVDTAPPQAYTNAGNPDATTNTGIPLGNPTDPPIPTVPAAPVSSATPPTPPGPPPAADWVPSQDGTGWVPPGHPQAWQPPAGSAPAGPATAPAAPGAPAAPMAPATPEAPSPVKGAFQDALLKMLSDNQAAPTLTDPTLKGQADAFALGQTRAKDRARSVLAERAAGQGGAGVEGEGFSQGLMGLEQQQGEAEGSFNAGLVGQELQQRRQQLMSTMALAGQQMTAEQQIAANKQLADMDAQIKREGMAQQGGQFSQSLSEQQRQSGIDAELKRMGITSQTQLGQGDLDLRRLLGSGQLNLGLLQALQQNSQFGQNLGAQLGMFGAGQNQSALLAMLGQMGG